MAKQQEPKPENVKDFIVVVSVNDYYAPTEVYTFHGTYRRACKKAVEKFLAEHTVYEYKRDQIWAVAREAQFSSEEAWHFDQSAPYGAPHITSERW